MSSSPLDALLIRAGHRGIFTFGQAALEHPNTVRFVAEPDPEQHAHFTAEVESEMIGREQAAF